MIYKVFWNDGYSVKNIGGYTKEEAETICSHFTKRGYESWVELEEGSK